MPTTDKIVSPKKIIHLKYNIYHFHLIINIYQFLNVNNAELIKKNIMNLSMKNIFYYR